MHFTLADLAADITQNSAESGADFVELEIRESAVSPAEFRFILKDNGKGMSRDNLDHAMDPFVTDGVKHPGRRVGLGIPFLIQTALQSGGGWRINSTMPGGETTVRAGGKADVPDAEQSGQTGSSGTTAQGASVNGVSANDTVVHGTTVEAWFDLANVDTPPAGDIPGLFRTILLFTGPKEIVLKRSRKGVAGKADLDYEVKKTELEEALGGELEDVSSLVLLGKYLHSLEGDDEE